MHRTVRHLLAASAVGLSTLAASASPAAAATVSSGTTQIVDDESTSAPIEVPADLVPASITLRAQHTWISDLTITVTDGTTSITLLDRPGFGTQNPGQASDLDPSHPVQFTDAEAGTPAEQMGSTLGADEQVCRDDGVCTFTPHSGQLASLRPGRTWTMTVADGETGDDGSFSWSVSDEAGPGGGTDPEPGAELPEARWFGLLPVPVLALGAFGGMALRNRRRDDEAPGDLG